MINAVNYLHGPLRRSAAMRLFEAFLRYLEPRHCLVDRLVHYGTNETELARLLKIAQQQYPFVRHRPFYRQAPVNLDDYWQRCQQFLTQPKAIILIMLSGTHHHWTLVYRMNATTLFLLDSSQLKYLPKRNCQLAPTAPPVKHHVLHPQHTYFLRLPKMKSNSGFTAGENPGEYMTHGPVTGDAILAMAQTLIRRKFSRGRVLDNPHSPVTIYPPT